MPDGSSLPEIKISQLPVGTTANLTDQLEANQAGVSRSITVGQVATTVAGSLPAPPASLPPSGPAGGALNGTYPNPGLVGGPLSNYALVSAIPTTLPPSGAAGGGLSGSYPNPLIRPSATNGQVLTTVGGVSTWAAPAASGGTVTSTSVVSANGLAGSVATPTTTPAITLSTTVTGMLKGNGTAISAAVAGTDYVTPAGLPASLPPSGAAGGGLTGTYPNPTVAPGSNGQVYTTVGGVAAWSAAATNKLLQTQSFETGAVATGSTIIPFDDTIPQITEGDQYMSLAITPQSATSKLIIDIVWYGSIAVAANIVVALFQDATANALAVVSMYQAVNTAPMTISFRHVMTSGTTSATTFRVRAGPIVAGTLTLNGTGGTRAFGGVAASSIVITEVLP